MPAPKHHKKATEKQITALKLLDEIDPETGRPFTKRKAMIKAGYSLKMANNPKLLMESQAITSLIERFHLELKDVGITTRYMAKKYAEHLEATKNEAVRVGTDDKGRPIFETIKTPDYHIQVETLKQLKDVYNLKPDGKQPEGLKRKITLEEFVLGSPQQETI